MFGIALADNVVFWGDCADTDVHRYEKRFGVCHLAVVRYLHSWNA